MQLTCDAIVSDAVVKAKVINIMVSFTGSGPVFDLTKVLLYIFLQITGSHLEKEHMHYMQQTQVFHSVLYTLSKSYQKLILWMPLMFLLAVCVC